MKAKLNLVLLASLYIGAGLNHFMMPEVYMEIIPPLLPEPELLVYLSGFAEVLLGLLVLPSRTRSFAGWGLVALLLAIFPANIYMSLHPELFPAIPLAALWIRLPLQFALIAWAYYSTRPELT